MVDLKNRDEISAYLKSNNKAASSSEVQIYIDAFFQYIEAEKNIRQNGSISLHPRTLVPFDNPYLRVKQNAVGLIQKSRKMRVTDKLWNAFEHSLKSEAKNEES